MIKPGVKFKLGEKEVVPLAHAGDEVLIFIEKGSIKWVKKCVLKEIMKDHK